MPNELSSTDSNPLARPLLPWNPWLALVTVVFIFIFTQFVGIQIVAIYPAIKHWSNSQTNDWLTNDITAQFFYVFLAEMFTVLLLGWFLRLFKTSFRAIGLAKAKLEDIG